MNTLSVTNGYIRSYELDYVISLFSVFVVVLFCMIVSRLSTMCIATGGGFLNELRDTLTYGELLNLIEKYDS